VVTVENSVPIGRYLFCDGIERRSQTSFVMQQELRSFLMAALTTVRTGHYVLLLGFFFYFQLVISDVPPAIARKLSHVLVLGSECNLRNWVRNLEPPPLKI